MNARKMIIAAFYSLLEKHTVSSISVGRIIETAEISKPTFYRYFYNKYEILNPVFSDVLEPLSGTNSSCDWRQALTLAFNRVYENKAIFKNGFKTDEQCRIRDNYMMNIIEGHIRSALARRDADLTDRRTEFAVRSYTHTLVAAICGWARDSARESVDVTVDNLCGTIPVSICKYLDE